VGIILGNSTELNEVPLDPPCAVSVVVRFVGISTQFCTLVIVHKVKTVEL